MKYSAYPAYKDSGVEWLGEIPTYWEKTRIKYVLHQIIDTEHKTAPFYPDGEYLVVRTSNVRNGQLVLDDAKYTDYEGFREWTKRGKPEPGDILFTREAPAGEACLVPENLPLCLGQRMVLFRVNHQMLDEHYGIWSLYGGIAAEFITSLSQGATVAHFNMADIANIPLLLPPLEEQAAIASFLDRETAKIDALIAKKERLIELLQEKRTAIISHAVTKGLDPTMPMRDSGVDWLGEVPAHWRVMLLKRVASVRYGLGQPPPEIPDGTPLIRATNVKSGSICEEGMLYVNPENVPESRDAILSPGEIIVVRSGAYTGDSAIIPPEYSGAIAGYDMVLTLKKGFSSFFAWQILSAEVRELQFGFCRMRAAQPHLNAEELRETIVVIPPFPEQQAIASYLDRETTKIDALIAKIREGIEKLKEYRTALISAAVTGKIDVRNEVAS
jgi:type I restriction enzyme S subunit